MYGRGGWAFHKSCQSLESTFSSCAQAGTSLGESQEGKGVVTVFLEFGL